LCRTCRSYPALLEAINPLGPSGAERPGEHLTATEEDEQSGRLFSLQGGDGADVSGRFEQRLPVGQRHRRISRRCD